MTPTTSRASISAWSAGPVSGGELAHRDAAGRARVELRHVLQQPAGVEQSPVDLHAGAVFGFHREGRAVEATQYATAQQFITKVQGDNRRCQTMIARLAHRPRNARRTPLAKYKDVKSETVRFVDHYSYKYDIEAGYLKPKANPTFKASTKLDDIGINKHLRKGLAEAANVRMPAALGGPWDNVTIFEMAGASDIGALITLFCACSHTKQPEGEPT